MTKQRKYTVCYVYVYYMYMRAHTLINKEKWKMFVVMYLCKITGIHTNCLFSLNIWFLLYTLLHLIAKTCKALYLPLNEDDVNI